MSVAIVCASLLSPLLEEIKATPSKNEVLLDDPDHFYPTFCVPAFFIFNGLCCSISTLWEPLPPIALHMP